METLREKAARIINEIHAILKETDQIVIGMKTRQDETIRILSKESDNA